MRLNYCIDEGDKNPIVHNADIVNRAISCIHRQVDAIFDRNKNDPNKAFEYIHSIEITINTKKTDDDAVDHNKLRDDMISSLLIQEEDRVAILKNRINDTEYFSKSMLNNYMEICSIIYSYMNIYDYDRFTTLFRGLSSKLYPGYFTTDHLTMDDINKLLRDKSCDYRVMRKISTTNPTHITWYIKKIK